MACRTVIGSPVSQLPLGLPDSELVEQTAATPDAALPNNRCSIPLEAHSHGAAGLSEEPDPPLTKSCA